MSIQDRESADITRRAIGLALGLSPVALLFASAAVGATTGNRPILAGVGFMIGAIVVALINFHLSFIRPRLFHMRHRSMEGYRHVSGLPGIGTVLVILGVTVGFGATGSSIIGLAAMGLDTGGSVWFLIAIWRDTSFWDS